MFHNVWSNPTTKDAYRLSLISILVTILAIVIGIVLYVSTGYSLCLVYATENIVDFISSVIVLWRFFAPSTGFDDKMECKLKSREERASLGISIILTILGCMVCISSLKKIKECRNNNSNDLNSTTTTMTDESNEVPTTLLEFQLSFWSFVIFGTLTIFKFRYSAKLNSESLYKDGICSFIGTILSVLIFFNTFLMSMNTGLWWIDPMISLVLGIIAIYIGFKAMWVARNYLFSYQWWCSSSSSDDTIIYEKDIDDNNNSNKNDMNTKNNKDDDNDGETNQEIV